MLEWWLRLTVGKMLTHDAQIATIVTSETSFGGLVGMAKSLLYYKTEDKGLRDAFEALAARLEAAEATRNNYLHSFWSPVVDSQLGFSGKYIRQKSTAKRRRGLHQKWEVKTPAEMVRDAESLRALGADLSEFSLRLQTLGIAPLPTVGLKLQPEAMAVVKKLRAEAGVKPSG